MQISVKDLYQGIKERIDFRIHSRQEYEIRVASKDSVLDIGGRNHESRSYRHLKRLSTNPQTKIVSTDISADYSPDIVDDICSSRLESESFEGINCTAILEHVEDYQSAVDHIYRILKPGGEAFFYVPFIWGFHDRTDHHRFTFTELDRMLNGFAEKKIILPDGNGYGGVMLLLMTFFQIAKFNRTWAILSRVTNALLSIPLTMIYLYFQVSGKPPRENLHEFIFYYTHIFVNHGFCAWVRK